MGNMAMPLSSSHTILNPIYNISPPQKKTPNKLWGEFNVLRQYYLKIKNLRVKPHFKSKRIVLWLCNIPNTFSNRKLNQMGWKVQFFTTTLVTYTCIHKISWTPFPIRKKPRGSSIHRGHKISFNPSFNIMWPYTILKLLIIKKWKSEELGMGGIGRGV